VKHDAGLRLHANQQGERVAVDLRLRGPRETKPDCPFPKALDLVAQGDQGRVSIAVPIDVPFAKVSRLLQAQFAGKTFPEDGGSSVLATIKQAKVAASGDRLLIELLVTVKKSGLMSLGADATVYVWGRPALAVHHSQRRGRGARGGLVTGDAVAGRAK
jgi:hypothetical protein